MFDFIVVGDRAGPDHREPSASLRALRVLRVLRLITALPSLKRVVAGLLAALPGMGSIVLLIALIYYVFAVMATKLFGDAKPELFGTLGDSLFTLFTVMTLEGWVDGVTKPVMETHPWAWIFFIVFIVFTTFMVLNLFIGVVVNAMQAEAEKGMAAERAAEREIIHEEAEPILAEVRRLRCGARGPAQGSVGADGSGRMTLGDGVATSYDGRYWALSPRGRGLLRHVSAFGLGEGVSSRNSLLTKRPPHPLCAC